jgi:aspartyl-tRNA synthetase
MLSNPIFKSMPMMPPSRTVVSSSSDGTDDAVKARVKAEREARKDVEKAAKEAKQAKKDAESASAAAAAAESAVVAPVSYLALDAPTTGQFGDYELFMSQGTTGRTFSSVVGLAAPAAAADSKVWVRGRVQSVRAKGSSCFLVVRQGAFDTVQAVLFKDKSSPEAAAASGRFLKWLGGLTPETVVELEGTVCAAEVKSCSRADVEVGGLLT